MTRQEIYDRIRELGSKDAFVLAEMKRLGFWTNNQPTVPDQLITQEADLYRQLNELLDKQRRYDNRKAILAEMRQARMAEAKKKRIDTKERREARLQERAEAWKIKRTTDISFLGEGVSAGLQPGPANPDRLTEFGLPHFESTLALAQAMNLTLSELRFLTFHRAVSTVSHYKRFYLPKKSGGKRLISAPMPRLKNAQYWVLEHVLNRVQPTEHAHGFVTDRSILTNAQPHLSQSVVINADLKDFFPTINYPRVKGLLVKLGYAESIATILALLCTESETDAVTLDGQTYYVANGERVLPQGAPTSPALTNLIGYRLDRRLRSMADTFGFAYTRYADDLTFSASGEAAGRVGQVLWAMRKIIDSEGFVLHPDKLTIMRRGRQQRVTGIIVNEKPGVDRATLRKFRALLHQIGHSGWVGKSWGNSAPDADLRNVVTGYANFVMMVKPEQGRELRQTIDTLLGRASSQTSSQPMPEPTRVPSSEPTPGPSTESPKNQPSADYKDWWDVL